MAIASPLMGLFCSQLGREALESGVELPSLPWVFMATAALIAVSMGFGVWSAVHISHRIAGPMYNIGKVLEQTRSGDLTARVQLRKGDYLFGVADSVNAHLQWLQEHPPVGTEVAEAADQPETVAAGVAPSDAV